jgi:uncharacterized DUF497 family protein/uncharacterized protein (DUF4415 family)
MDVEWDPEKAPANLQRHGIEFSYATDVLEDEYALTREDPHAQGGQRFVSVGMDGLAGCTRWYTPVAVSASGSFPHAGRPGATESSMSANDRDDDIAEEYDFSQARRGPVIPPRSGKTRITIRPENDLLQWFHERVEAQGGGSYQALINQALRAYIVQQSGLTEAKLEALLRRIIRDELQHAG